MIRNNIKKLKSEYAACPDNYINSYQECTLELFFFEFKLFQGKCLILSKIIEKMIEN